MGSAWAIVVAGGSGSRYGGHKQFEALAGRRVVDWSLAAAREACDGVVLVVPAGVQEAGAVTGGATRSDSVRAGLAAVPDDAEVVLVHDAARPLAGPDLFARAIAAVRAGADGVVPVVPVTDTVKRVDGELVVETLDRSSLVAVQTPQAFDARMLRDAHASGGDATDDAGLVESIGGKVVVVDGDRWNIKLTTPEDLMVMEALLAHRGGWRQ